jgi:hypothetical protein
MNSLFQTVREITKNCSDEIFDIVLYGAMAMWFDARAELASLRQATISVIERGEQVAKLDSILAVLAALDLKFRIGERSKGHRSDIENLF